MVTFASVFDVLRPMATAFKWSLENSMPSFEEPKLNRTSMSNPALMAVTYQMVNSRPVAVSQQQQGVEMARRIAGTVIRVNTAPTTPAKPSSVGSRVGQQISVRSVNVSGKQQVSQTFANAGR
jgi:hypothetical protein